MRYQPKTPTGFNVRSLEQALAPKLRRVRGSIAERRAELAQLREFGYLDLGDECGFDPAEDWTVFWGLDRLAHLVDTHPRGA